PSLISLANHPCSSSFSFFFPTFIFSVLSPPATTDTYTLSLHDALPIYHSIKRGVKLFPQWWTTYSWASLTYVASASAAGLIYLSDRKSTRLNSSHQIISYAVFCLKKKKQRMVEPLSLTPRQPNQ